MPYKKLIEFLWKSSLKSFPAVLDALRYLDGKWVQEEAKYELFDEARRIHTGVNLLFDGEALSQEVLPGRESTAGDYSVPLDFFVAI